MKKDLKNRYMVLLIILPLLYSCSKFENKLFNEFPELKNKNIYYISNGIIIDKSGSLKDNKIKNGANILINYNE